MNVAHQPVPNHLPVRTAIWWCFKFLLIGIFFFLALFVAVDLLVWLAHQASLHQVPPIQLVNRTWMPEVALVSLPIAAFYVIKGARREPWSALWMGGDPQRFGFVAPQRHGYALAAMAAMVFAAIYTAVELVWHAANPMRREVTEPALILFLSGVIFVPAFYEVLLHGFLFTSLAQKWSVAAAVTGSALGSALFSLPGSWPRPAEILADLAFGLVLGWLRIKMRSVYPCIAAAMLLAFAQFLGFEFHWPG